MEHPDITRVNRDGELEHPPYEAVCVFCGMRAVRGEYITVRGRTVCTGPDCAGQAYVIYADSDLTDFADEFGLSEEACDWWNKNLLSR